MRSLKRKKASSRHTRDSNNRVDVYLESLPVALCLERLVGKINETMTSLLQAEVLALFTYLSFTTTQPPMYHNHTATHYLRVEHAAGEFAYSVHT